MHQEAINAINKTLNMYQIQYDNIDKNIKNLTKAKEIKEKMRKEINIYKYILSILKENNSSKTLTTQIDLMAEMIAVYDLDIPTLRIQQKERYCDFMKSDEDCCEKVNKNCTDCIKEYFSKLANTVNSINISKNNKN